MLRYARHTPVLRADSVVAFIEPLPYTVKPHALPDTMPALASRLPFRRRRKAHRKHEGDYESGLDIVQYKQSRSTSTETSSTAKASIMHLSLRQTAAPYNINGLLNAILDIDGTGCVESILIGTFTRRSGDSTPLGDSVPCLAILRAVSTDAPRNILFLIWHGNKSWS